MILPVFASLYLAKLTHCFPQSLVVAGDDASKLPIQGQVLPVKMTKFHVDSKIQFRYARTQVISHIKNPGSAPNKADFKMIIPDSAFISNFSMIIKDVEYVAQVKEKEKAQKSFDEAVSSGIGAGIISKDVRDANVFTVTANIEPGAKVIFKLMYEELLERKSGKYQHFINIDPQQLVDDMKIEVFINESLPISSISVPELIQSNEIDFIGFEENRIAEVEENVDGIANNARIVFAPDKFYQEDAGAQGLSGQFLVEYDVDRQGQESEVQVIDGYFVHYFVPDQLDSLAKHVVFVLDVSGSMGGEKIDQLKDSMFTVLDDMTETDYFNIITFSSSVQHWHPNTSQTEGGVAGSPQIVEATEENKNLAIKHILGLNAGGGTNINEAMLEGLKIAESALRSEKLPEDVNSMIIFLTDGLPSSGETNTETIKNNIKNANSKLDVPIFSIGFGRDLDFDLIKEISEQANSFSKRIYEGSDAALQLEDFFAQISSPLISNLKFNYVGGLVQNNSISQASFKTFFKGGEYIIAGKLNQDTGLKSQSLTIQVDGRGKKGPYRRDIQICLRSEEMQDKDRIQDKEGSTLLLPIIPPPQCLLPPQYPQRSLTQDFMQRLHAFLNIKQLIRKADLGNEEEKREDKEKALTLALDNNFVTDLTSLVVIRPDMRPIISKLERPLLSSQGISKQKISFRGRLPSSNRVYAGPPPPKPSYASSRPQFESSGTFSSVRAVVGYASVPSYLASTKRRKTTTYRPLRTSTESGVQYISKNDTQEDKTECAGSLTLFTKTYLRGDKAVLEEEEADLANISFDNLSVSASVSGSCCWQIFSEQNYSGNNILLSSQGSYTSVSSLGSLFREVSSVRKHLC